MLEASALSEVTTYRPDVVSCSDDLHVGATTDEIRVHSSLRRLDVQRGAARMSRLPYVAAEVTTWERIAGRLAADSGVQRGLTHVAELRRRERKRLHMYLSSAVRGDMTLLDVMEPLWVEQPVGLAPHSSNPVAMWRAFPGYEQVKADIDDSLPTCAVPTSERHQRWLIGHMWHCQRCQHYSAVKHGSPAPVQSFKDALGKADWQIPEGWSADPDCYQRLMIHFVRTGYEATIDPGAPVTVEVMENPTHVFDEFDSMVEALESWESLPFETMSRGQWKKPTCASALLPVIRSRDMREFLKHGTPYTVRPCINLRSSGVNDMFLPWPFRMAGPDSVARLLGRLLRRPQGYTYADAAAPESRLHLTCTDLSKHYLHLALGPRTRSLTFFSDPRREKVWRGSEQPPPEWRRQQRPRFGRWRHFLTCPFGIRPLVAYASALSGEMCQMLLALGVVNNFFIDDCLQMAFGSRQALAAAVLAEKLFAWLGFKVNQDKRLGPARVLKYLGIIIDLDKRELRLTDQHRSDLLAALQELKLQQRIGQKDLSSLCGKMNWVAQVMTGGITFVRGLLNLMKAPEGKPLPDPVMLGSVANRHVDWWITQLEREDWDGSRLIPDDHEHPVRVITFKSDASGTMMWGYAYAGRLYWCTPIEEELPESHIQFRELIPLAHAAEELGHLWADAIIRVGVDNAAVCYAINRGNSKDVWMQRLLERIAVSTLRHRFTMVAVHCDRRFNQLADMTTRFQVLDDFCALLPSDVRVPDEPNRLRRTCRTRSPGSSSVVFSLQLLPCAPDRSQGAPPSGTGS